MTRTQYGLHQESVGLINSNKEEKWNKAIFWIFDAPKLIGKPLEVHFFIVFEFMFFLGKN